MSSPSDVKIVTQASWLRVSDCILTLRMLFSFKTNVISPWTRHWHV